MTTAVVGAAWKTSQGRKRGMGAVDSMFCLMTVMVLVGGAIFFAVFVKEAWTEDDGMGAFNTFSSSTSSTISRLPISSPISSPTSTSAQHFYHTHTSTMAASSFNSTPSSTMPISNFGRGGYNGPAEDEEDEYTLSAPLNFGRGGYNRGPDDDEEEDGRGGYN